jgi:CMP-N-acetylneuraminic acid synthetase
MNKKLVVIIPVRLGSQRLKNKNILPIKGLPMFVYVALEVKKSKLKPSVFISSESKKIKVLCKKFNLSFIQRPKKLSSHSAEKQEAIVHGTTYISKKFKFKPKTVVSLQCNSPEFDHRDLDKALKFFKKKFPQKEKKELVSIGFDNCQNAAFRIMSYEAVFQKTLSTNIIVFYTKCLDIHTNKDYKKVLKLINGKS